MLIESLERHVKSLEGIQAAINAKLSKCFEVLGEINLDFSMLKSKEGIFLRAKCWISATVREKYRSFVKKESQITSEIQYLRGKLEKLTRHIKSYEECIKDQKQKRKFESEGELCGA